MQAADSLQLDRLVNRTREVVKSRNPAIITEGIKNELEALIKSRCLCLPQEFCEPNKDSYARRLLYEDKEYGFVMVAMTWGVGQGTPIHDHSGIWCVEGVISGEIEVVSYEMVQFNSEKETCELEEKQTIRSSTGGAGALIPPFEYHLIRNALTDKPSVTLHVYGGNIAHCGVYLPTGKKNKSVSEYKRERADLKYSL